MKRTEKDDAVSPVVGVMLMLVVTIIIAAVVAAFAGGIATETKATPSAILSVDDCTLTYFNDKYKSEGVWVNNPVYDLTNMTIVNHGGETLSTEELSLLIEKNLASKTYAFAELLDKTYWGSPIHQSLGPGDSVTLSMSHGDPNYGLISQSVSDGTPINWKVIYNPTGQAISSGTLVISTSNFKVIDKYEAVSP